MTLAGFSYLARVSRFGVCVRHLGDIFLEKSVVPKRLNKKYHKGKQKEQMKEEVTEKVQEQVTAVGLNMISEYTSYICLQTAHVHQKGLYRATQKRNK